jgi:hypothetical protein
VSLLRTKIRIKNMREKPTNAPIIHSVYYQLNAQLVYLFVFHASINEMHGPRSKIPSKRKSRQAALRGGIQFLR